MVKQIALFNHKGGVSKTTTTFNLGWMLAEKGYTVVMVDADPQCNLTGMVLDYRKVEDLENFYTQHPNSNIRNGVAPAFESKPRSIEALDCVEIEARPKLYLMAGHIGLAEYEVTLGIAQQLSGSLPTLQNLPGAFSYLFQQTAEKYHADYLLIDMSPSLSAINQNLLMTSNFFIVPASPDFFSVMAIDSLASILKKWAVWAKRIRHEGHFQDEETVSYPLHLPELKFLGTVIQKYRPRQQNPSQAFQTWINAISEAISKSLVPVLKEANMLLKAQYYADLSDYCLAQISDFNSLIAKSQAFKVPVFALDEAQLQNQGVVKQISVQQRDHFHSVFSDLAERVIGMTQDAVRV